MRLGETQKGRFDVRPGMSFRMPDLDLMIPGDFDAKFGEHPWLVVGVEDNYVEIVMCRTRECAAEGKSLIGKRRDKDLIKIENPCPPMDPEHQRESSYDDEKYRILPKKELFSHELQLLNMTTEKRNFETEGIRCLCMDEKEIKKIRKYLMSEHGTALEKIDPYGIVEDEYMLEDLEFGEPVPKGFSRDYFEEKYGWEHLPAADPRAPYPSKSLMTPYERQDKELIRIVNDRYKNPYVPEEEVTLTDEDLKDIPIPDDVPSL